MLYFKGVQQQIKQEIELITKYDKQHDQTIKEMLNRYSKNEIPPLDYESASERLKLIHSIINDWFIQDPSLKESFTKSVAKKPTLKKSSPNKIILSSSPLSKEIQGPNKDEIPTKVKKLETSFLTEQENTGKIVSNDSIPPIDTAPIETWNLTEEVIQFENEIMEKSSSNTQSTKKTPLLKASSTDTVNVRSIDTEKQTNNLIPKDPLNRLISKLDSDQILSSIPIQPSTDMGSIMKDFEDLKRQVGLQSYNLNDQLKLFLKEILNEIISIKNNDYMIQKISKLEKGNFKIKDSKVAESLNLAFCKFL